MLGLKLKHVNIMGPRGFVGVFVMVAIDEQIPAQQAFISVRKLLFTKPD